MRSLAVLRPEPGNAATCVRIVATGGTALALPLFEVRPLAWTPPDPARFDGLVLTSANAVRHGGAGLARLRDLSVFAVGEATAAAARSAGLQVALVGDGDAEALAQHVRARGVTRALHLAGRDRAAELPGIADTIAVYASEVRAIDPATLDQLAGSVALVHSPRAGARLAELVIDRSAVRLAAISAKALAAAGQGWAASRVAEKPHDAALVAAARRLAGALAD